MVTGISYHFLPTARLRVENIGDHRRFGRRNLPVPNHPDQGLPEGSENTGGIDKARNLHQITRGNPRLSRFDPDTGLIIQKIEKATGINEGDHPGRNLSPVALGLGVKKNKPVEGHLRGQKRIYRRRVDDVDILFPIGVNLQTGSLGSKICDVEHDPTHPHPGIDQLLPQLLEIVAQVDRTAVAPHDQVEARLGLLGLGVVPLHHPLDLNPLGVLRAGEKSLDRGPKGQGNLFEADPLVIFYQHHRRKPPRIGYPLDDQLGSRNQFIQVGNLSLPIALRLRK